MAPSAMGVYRNRTNKFVEFRQDARSSRMTGAGVGSGFGNDQVGLLGRGEVELNVVDTKPPHWVEIVDAIHRGLDTIRQKNDELSELHKQHLLPGFDDRKEEEKGIEILTKSITSAFVKIHKLIQSIVAEGKGEKVSNEERLARKNVQTSLGMALQELSLKFRKDQKDYVERLRAVEQRVESNFDRLDISGFRQPATPGSALMPRDADGFQQVLVESINTMDEVVSEREREIAIIQKQMEELAQMFKDLATIVIEQGQLLDRIDYNLEQAHHHTEDAIGELTKAKESQSSFRCKICILLLIIMIVVVAGILVWKLVPRDTGS